MLLAKQKPFKLFGQFFASRAPRERFDHDFRAVPFDVFAEKRVCVLDRLIDFAHVKSPERQRRDTCRVRRRKLSRTKRAATFAAR
jgi:hypothetical protein